MRKIGEKCNDVEVQSLCHKGAELQTCIFYSFEMAINFPEITLLGIHALLHCTVVGF